ncbi:hypothetical protein N474_07270 [Pseudoalteromonas luteoviolacea CPMOR-2]|uniref:Lipoprotein n=1 Tax=Pseudoalteromonas luteoviolacea DSM 6061 TaxID=1365250 RepID=A0A166WDF4_9GAMM|nr:hypothetical protein [Pseudoalteromonas luteoviolacea]KZN37261.1 hypothetical protein N475_16330 [Pseudoalteromonas luteoviolacea DSM 6061]KZN59487.1 hypothetical protein N474_07270 [Pseudoalteromonas luteoviolacea CPMOR-2]MBE0387516.1 hypothetical protein [Pseudoalteromonas luteoviolacea DSM 6061]
MKMIPISLAIALLAGCNSTTSTENQSATADQNTTADNGLICSREARTGTRFGKRTCRTQEQIDRQEEEAKRMLDSRGNNTGAQGGL